PYFSKPTAQTTPQTTATPQNHSANYRFPCIILPDLPQFSEEEYLMPRSQITETRSGPRYVAAFPIRAEWDTDDGVHVVSDGETENIGPEGTLVHLLRELPPVGSRVNLLVLGEDGEKLRVIAEV